MDRLGAGGGLRGSDCARPVETSLNNGRKTFRIPRLRWALRHPLAVLERGGFGPVQTAGLLLFASAVLGRLMYTYFAYLS